MKRLDRGVLFCFNAIVFSLDDVLYNAVSKPLFELLQKWFHWNRFQLISSFLLGEAIVCVGITLTELTLLGLGRGDGYSMVVGLMFSISAAINFVRYAVVKEDLKTCSEVFESGGYPKPTTRMLIYMASAASRGEATAFFFVLSALLWVWSLFTGGSVVTALFLALWTFALFNRHLWRSSDIDPKDRKTLLSAEDTASSSASP